MCKVNSAAMDRVKKNVGRERGRKGGREGGRREGGMDDAFSKSELFPVHPYTVLNGMGEFIRA
jgi:hypothetical protein